jgi:hypothetical protein
MAVATMKRKLKWITAVLAVSLLGFGTVLLLWPRDRITGESYQKIRLGMTEEEVAEILGGPRTTSEQIWDQFRTLAKQTGKVPFVNDGVFLEEPEGFDKREPSMSRYCPGRRGYIWIQFDQEGHVVWKCFQRGRYADSTFVDRLRDWLGW